MMDLTFKMFELGTIQITIAGIEHTVRVDASEHGVRFTVVIEKAITIGDEKMVTGSSRVYFGEGRWLSLPTIEEGVVELLGGDEEDVEKFSMKYDDLMAAALPEFITGNRLKGFLKIEYERLTSSNDLQNQV